MEGEDGADEDDEGDGALGERPRADDTTLERTTYCDVPEKRTEIEIKIRLCFQQVRV